MLHMVPRDSAIWNYLPHELKGLIEDGEMLFEHAGHVPSKVSDYSYLVFPFSKAYEGFLKRLFLDLDLIKEDEYYGDDIRIGRILNPHFIDEHSNVFNKLCTAASGKKGNVVVEELWRMWKVGRNQVFHYWPHNYRKLSFDEAKEIVSDVIKAMDDAIANCEL